MHAKSHAQKQPAITGQQGKLGNLVCNMAALCMLVAARILCFSGANVSNFGQPRAPPSRGSSFGSDTSSAGGTFYPSQAPPPPGAPLPGGPRPMARAPAFGSQQGGFSQPGGPGVQLPSSYGPAQAVLDQFEALTLGPAAPGQPGDAGLLMIFALCAVIQEDACHSVLREPALFSFTLGCFLSSVEMTANLCCDCLEMLLCLTGPLSTVSQRSALIRAAQ